MFERAGDYFLRGKVDPRLLVRAFSGYRGKTIGSAEEVEVYEGLRTVLESMADVEVISELSIGGLCAIGGRFSLTSQSMRASAVKIHPAHAPILRHRRKHQS